MSYSDPSGSVTGNYGEGREPGSRRRKLYGYLKAANELRQSYQAQWSAQRNQEWNEDHDIPGAFPDGEVFRNGDEEMVLFPSYARRHIKKKPAHMDRPGAHDDLSHPYPNDDAEYWKREWEKYEDDNAIVDVDVRGWVYTPHRGPLNRRNRLLLAVARRLSGIPAQVSTPSGSRSTSPDSYDRRRMDDSSTRHEEEIALKEAQKIINRGEDEASAASKGKYSEEPSRQSRDDSPYNSRSISPESTDPVPGQLRKSNTDSTLGGDDDAASIMRRRNWLQPEQMSRDELKIANDHLMARLRPFMSVPLVNVPITVFFFDDVKSQSRTVYTNESGHFTVRAALDFVPTHVRVLASEDLSAVEEVRITETKGVTLISDIDDTIKHSAITSGAKEIFRNTFIRELGDLTVEGVREWYSRLYDMGVNLHYVSNSPWQLYPLLRSYFRLAGLPPGSFHLKAYTGMLQGIFEPAAERKRGSLEKIMRDFPERRFILVGDSGEADLEVYTETALENPGRVMAIFIRDVTTQDTERRPGQARNGPFNPNNGAGKRDSDASSIYSKVSDVTEDRPALPSRKPVPQRPKPSTPNQSTGNLIDLDDEPSDSVPAKSSANDLAELSGIVKKQPPQRPSKPMSLRSTPSQPKEEPVPENSQDSSDPAGAKKSTPPPPPKPRRSGTSPSIGDGQQRPYSGRAQFSSSTQSLKSMNGDNPSNGQGFAASAAKQISNAYNSLPSRNALIPNTSSLNNDSANSSDGESKPPLPPRRGISSYPAAAAQFASSRLPTWTSGTEQRLGALPPSQNSQNAGYSSYLGGSGQSPYNKKEDMWRRRWARAEDLLKNQGVILRSWKVGEDAMDECCRIVQKALKEMDRDNPKLSGQQRDGRPPPPPPSRSTR